MVFLLTMDVGESGRIPSEGLLFAFSRSFMRSSMDLASVRRRSLNQNRNCLDQSSTRSRNACCSSVRGEGADGLEAGAGDEDGEAEEEEEEEEETADVDEFDMAAAKLLERRMDRSSVNFLST